MAGDGTFLTSFNGQIEYIDVTAAAGSLFHCKYEIVSGPDWKVVSGLTAGISQTAHVVVNGDKIVFNFPVEITFKSSNPYGWPQIVISLYTGTNLQGYGRIHLPFQSGLHNLKAPLSKPVPSTYLGYLASFFGYQPELIQASILATGEGNHLIQMVSNGYARISVNVLSKGLQDFGYDVGKKHIIN